MPRLSVSLDAEQEDWILEKKREMGVSKGKVIRECIEEARTGNSLLTTPVQSGESGDDDRLQDLEHRLESLEEAIRTSTVSREDQPPSTPSARGDKGIAASPADRVNTEAIDNVSDTVSNSETETDAHSEAADAGSSYDLPGSVLGDIDDTSSDPDDTTSEPQSSSSSDPSTAADATSNDHADGQSSPAESSPSAEPGDTNAESTTPASQDDSTAPSTRSRDTTEPSPKPDSATPADSSTSRETPSDASDAARPTASEPTEDPDDDDEIEKVDVDKSDPDAVQSYLDSTLSQADHATAVFTCWKRLRDRGTIHTRAMQSLHDDYPLGYDNAREWWEDAIEPELVKIPGVQPPEGGGKLYRFSY